MRSDFETEALEYHRLPTPGKISVVSTKPVDNQRDLALAYSPGVAAACHAIVADPGTASELTARANLVGVITNGTAVLGLGAIGPLAAKPVMEGKAVLFKKFAGIDVFDIEIDETDPQKLVDIIAALEPTFGAINLEDIKAPECFEVESALRARMNIPVFHDDQHGTAIIVAAAILNGLKLVGKSLQTVRLAVSGAGAAALSCLDLLVELGFPVENILVSDIAGVVYEGRSELMDAQKQRYARPTSARQLAEIMVDADVFLGLSAAGVVTREMIASMAANPLILALANPVPEILPNEIKAVREDAIIATGRSDYPNQVNNALCFPYIFRGALDVGATEINSAMKHACVYALAELTMAEPSDIVINAYGGQSQRFGADYIIPKPFDPRLIVQLAPAVAKAAIDSGVARTPIADFEQYRQKLNEFVFRSGQVMRPLFAKARTAPQRVVYAEGEEERVLRAVQNAVDEKMVTPILVGRKSVITQQIEHLGLRLVYDQDYRVLEPQNNPAFEDFWRLYHAKMERKGISPDIAKTLVRSSASLNAALLLMLGEADALICGTQGRFARHLEHINDVVGLSEGVSCIAALNVLMCDKGTFFISDSYVNPDPSAAEIAEITLMAAEAAQRFGIVPKIALLSHSNFGASLAPSAAKMREALEIINKRAPELEIEGEMHADAALVEDIRTRIFPNSRLKGMANTLIMPNIDAANIAFNFVKALGCGLVIGPVLLGMAKPVHILTPSVTARGILNMSALAVVEAQALDQLVHTRVVMA